MCKSEKRINRPGRVGLLKAGGDKFYRQWNLITALPIVQYGMGA